MTLPAASQADDAKALAALEKAGRLFEAHSRLAKENVLNRWKDARRYEENPSLPFVLPAPLFFGDRMFVDLREIVSQTLYAFGSFEHALSAFFFRALRPGDVFFDVGAHIGYFSLLARHRVGSDGMVVSFEPMPQTALLLQRNVERFSNIHIVRKAVWHEVGRVTMNDFGEAHSPFSSVSPIRLPEKSFSKISAQRTLDVEAVTLDAVARARGVTPHYVKIDAESAELSVLRGMNSLLSGRRPVVAVEVGDYQHLIDRGVPASRDTLRHLSGHDYALFEPTMQTLRPHNPRDGFYEYGNIVCIPKERVNDYL